MQSSTETGPRRHARRRPSAAEQAAREEGRRGRARALGQHGLDVAPAVLAEDEALGAPGLAERALLVLREREHARVQHGAIRLDHKLLRQLVRLRAARAWAGLGRVDVGLAFSMCRQPRSTNSCGSWSGCLGARARPHGQGSGAVELGWLLSLCAFRAVSPLDAGRPAAGCAETARTTGARLAAHAQDMLRLQKRTTSRHSSYPSRPHAEAGASAGAHVHPARPQRRVKPRGTFSSSSWSSGGSSSSSCSSCSSSSCARGAAAQAPSPRRGRAAGEAPVTLRPA